MELFVIHSDFHDEDKYFVVDEKNLYQKTELLDDYPEYERLEFEEELKALKVYHDGGGENWQVINGLNFDFYKAVIVEIKW